MKIHAEPPTQALELLALVLALVGEPKAERTAEVFAVPVEPCRTLVEASGFMADTRATEVPAMATEGFGSREERDVVLDVLTLVAIRKMENSINVTSLNLVGDRMAMLNKTDIVCPLPNSSPVMIGL